MITFRQILCAFDFSDSSIRALAYATAFASAYKAGLEVLHVVPTIDVGIHPWLPQTGEPPPEYLASSRAEITRAIEDASSVAGAERVAAEAVTLAGRAHDVIIRRAQTRPADLLVMGTHGRSGLDRLVLGSVTERVLRTAPCPVLTVPPAVSTASAASLALKRILCPIDFSPSSLKALQYALDLGRQAGGSVTVLHAVEYVDPDDRPEPSPFDPCYQVIVEDRNRRKRRIDHAREQLHAQLAGESTTWCEIREAVVIDRAYKAILSHATEAGADLIVMGAQGMSGIELMLYGSTTQHVVRAASCPVMTVHT